MSETSAKQRPLLIDGMGRKIVNLRISVTDRCNFRCTYCMPADNVEFMDRGELLSFEEITRIARVVSKMGIYRLRLTGGEPLLRKDLPVLIKMLDDLEDIEDIALTTNAFFLKDQAVPLQKAGLKRLNISLDALDKEKFAHVNRRDCLQQVLDGIAASRNAGFESIKINAVAVKNFSEEEILKLVDMGREQDLEIRFIEFMPLDADQAWERDKVLFGHEIIDLIKQQYDLIPIKDSLEIGPASEFSFADGKGKIGIITAVSNPFCDYCNRIRMTADGKLRTCLFSTNEHNLKELIRAGATDADIEQRIRDALVTKEPGHKINLDSFERPVRAMHAIGG
ncbi:MAG: GTP 3',8-cyclase MoaA [Nitrospinaceae bacterium]|nr:GTP 3',8-cyclase MoaA [Nitrospinaceae bacterium]NIR54042.1 GTP 3',8-cyclase MoaA [Nitrospinaceae bacterium]NIS84459.1 GTP 3',8-cyclase MoaA [Nitrospinaceae bacterium]NIT81255.1 GTP 3',8-cyclase MoaA [Nitrospinaceae bacterium]NIU43542.1 GTP 3',8-cyclase MoaA [Nitrospinaceae bacterium]